MNTPIPVAINIDRDQIPTGDGEELNVTVTLDLTPPDSLPPNSPSPEGSEA